MSTEKRSDPARTRNGRRNPTRPKRLPETLTVGLPPGSLARIDQAADTDTMTRPEWVRAALRRALDLTRKRSGK